MARTKKNVTEQTTAQRLSSVIKSARDIMRKDKGLSGDLDRLPMLTWIMFLKFLDDMEQIRAEEAKLASETYKPAIEPPYRWRDWATDPAGITGDELIAFVNQEEAVLPDGSKGPGLFAYLRSLQSDNGRSRQDVIATVFRGVINRMINGYLLRDVINLVDDIHFTASEEIHTLSRFYESMLKEMRDAAGDSGEFYSPRPVVRFMVEVVDPQLGETILDPACGTGGFLAESYDHLAKQCQSVEDHEILQAHSLFGGEAKPLPYLLGQMNLLLHGLEYPQIIYGNSLSTPLGEIGDRDRVDIILTNPPFGGEEEAGILSNFPDDKRTSETALLFLQLIMRKLRRPGHDSERGGRAAVVVPNGVLFGDGVCARIKEQLLTEFNLHTIVRLPNGVFAPYTSIPTNLLFFDRTGPTKEIWYYEHPLPEGRKNYTKTKPLRYEEFAPCLEWWNSREENEQAWRVSVEDVLKYDENSTLTSANLDLKNPNSLEAQKHRPLPELIGDFLRTEQRVLLLMREIQGGLTHNGNVGLWPLVSLENLLEPVAREEAVDPGLQYKLLGAHWYAGGLYVKEEKYGSNIRASKLYRVENGDFVYNRLFAWKGAFAIASDEVAGCYVSNEFPCFRVLEDSLDCGYLAWYFSREAAWNEALGLSYGATPTSRNRLKHEPSQNVDTPPSGT